MVATFTVLLIRLAPSLSRPNKQRPLLGTLTYHTEFTGFCAEVKSRLAAVTNQS